MKVEILAFSDCPNLEAAKALVTQTLLTQGAEAQISITILQESEVRSAPNFAGSPTILVNGRDVEPASPTGFSCRLYAKGQGVPALESVARAISRAREEEGSCRKQL